MLVIAYHDIQDPEKFWALAQSITAALPLGFKVHSVMPSMDMKMGTCVWEAPSVMDVQKFIDDAAGSFSKNFCYQVNEAASMGLPKVEMEAAVHN